MDYEGSVVALDERENKTMVANDRLRKTRVGPRRSPETSWSLLSSGQIDKWDGDAVIQPLF